MKGVLTAKGLFEEQRVEVTWSDGELGPADLDWRVRWAFENAGLTPVEVLPAVLREPLKEPLGFWAVAERVLTGATLEGDEGLVAEVLGEPPEGAVE